jgi:hypothetical protein
LARGAPFFAVVVCFQLDKQGLQQARTARSGGMGMSEWPEDERDRPEWIGLLIAAAAGMICMCIGWASLEILQYPQDLAGLALGGVIGYGMFKGMRWLSRRRPVAAVASTLAMIVAIVILWPVACATQGRTFGIPEKQSCRCAGLTVTTDPKDNNMPITSYCIGWETQDVWEEVIDIN